MCVCMCICVCVCASVCVYDYVCGFMCKCVWLCLPLCVHMYVCVHDKQSNKCMYMVGIQYSCLVSVQPQLEFKVCLIRKV